MEKRVLKLEVLERNAGAVRFKIAEQSHREKGFGNEDYRGEAQCCFAHNGFYIYSILHPAIGDKGLLTRGANRVRDNREMFCSEEIYDKKIVPAVKAYNDTNGGFGFKDVCPTCGREIKEWKPENGEAYSCFDNLGEVVTAKNFFVGDTKRIEIGNYFKTPELAETAAEAVKKVLKEAKHS